MEKKYKKKFLLILIIFLSIFNLYSNNLNLVYASADTIYLGGYPAGFCLETKGALVVSLCDVITPDGLKSPAKDAQIEVGDKIISIDEKQINNASDIASAINSCEKINAKVKRNGEIIEKTIFPAVDMGGEYKLGVFVKDEICGIGTITYIKNGRFASLGHPISDNEGILEVSGGSVYNCSIIGFVKGQRGNPGELKGVFIKNNIKATIDKNQENGVYGCVVDKISNDLKEIEIGEAKVGNASIFSTINGSSPKEYSISIIKVDDNLSNKNFVIKVTDDELLNQTGGIVQGMSGSPIVQNGKLVGAVTHVFINDPSRGFGIKINNMINN